MSREAIRAAFEAQAVHCAHLGSPFMARMMPLIPDALPDGPVLERLTTWPGDVGHRADAVPLRLAGGLHALARAGHSLAAAYPPHDVPDAALSAALARTLEEDAPHLLDWLDGPPQTNEVRRAAALIAGAHVVAGRFALPIELAELGASAGLNLAFPRFALMAGAARLGPADAALTLAPDWTGPPPPAATLDVTGARGVDLAPVDPFDPEDRARLLAYLWPDQPFRRDLTEAAIAAAPPRVELGDAIGWLARRLAEPHPGRALLVFHTVAWQYFPRDAATRGEALLADAGARATEDDPLARLSMEQDDTGAPGAAITLTTWPGGTPQVLGRICFHGRWVRWTGPAESP